MTDFFGSGSSAPTSTGSLNNNPAGATPITPTFPTGLTDPNPTEVPGQDGTACKQSYQSYFLSKSFYVIPFAEWSAGRIVNRKIPMKGKSLAFGWLGDGLFYADATNYQNPVGVITFKQFQANEFVNYGMASVVASAVGQTKAKLPPSAVTVFDGNDTIFTFENDFEEFYLSIDPGIGVTAGDFFVEVSPCESAILRRS